MSNSDPDFSIIDELENECYLKTNLSESLRNEVKSKIEDFSSWFNSTARLYLLRSPPEDSEPLIYLLLNLKKKLKFAISEINRSIANNNHSFACGVCGETVQVQPWQNVWSTLQDHPHFEEAYRSSESENYENGGDSSTTNASVDEDSSENSSILDLPQTVEPVPEESGLNDFRFNFSVTYDKRVESTLYPEAFVSAARTRDNLTEYTIQRCGIFRGVCLLCPCNLMSRGRVSKLTPFTIRNHVSGQKHLKCASMVVHTNALKQYHEFWRRQDPSFQAHQVHFVPEIAKNCFKCQLCLDLVAYENVVKHIVDKPHQNRVVKIFNSQEGNLKEVHLLDMQVQIYEGVVDNLKKEESAKEVKIKNASPPECVFVRSIVNDINLPNRYREHLSLFRKVDDLINCKVCNRSFINDVTNIRGHIFSALHKERCGLNFPTYGFFCEICNTHIKDEMLWEDHFLKGPNRHANLSWNRRQKLTEYECTTCMLVIYGDDLSLGRHTARVGKLGKARGDKTQQQIDSLNIGILTDPKLPLTIKKLFKNNIFIETEARLLQHEATTILNNQERMQQCLKNLEEAVSGLYPNCKAYPFGSRMSGLGNNHSDLDVFMDVGDMYCGTDKQDSLNQEQFVRKVAKILKQDDFSSVIPIPSARTPIVKVHHNLTDLDCDISFRHALGVENTKFLKFCIDLQPITQPFILLLKRWSDYCYLKEHITSYGLALMAVFFLQTGGYLLSVKTVKYHNSTEALVIDGWETINYTVPVDKMKEFVKPYTDGIKQLLRDFFYYFSRFDYANEVVCPLLGTTVPKLSFNEKPEESLPVEMKNYVERIRKGNGQHFRGSSAFCIQDPFDLSHNLAKACQHFTVAKVKKLCTLTYELLDASK